MNSLKKSYTGLKLTSEVFACESPVLVGSKTLTSIKVNSVEVEEYKPGFGDTPGVNDFEEINFD